MEQVGESFVLFLLLKSISFPVLDTPQGTLSSSKKGSNVKGSCLLLNRSGAFFKAVLLSESQKLFSRHAPNERFSDRAVTTLSAVLFNGKKKKSTLQPLCLL